MTRETKRGAVLAMRPIRLTAILTHPVQYYAPWFRHIAARCRDIDVTVLYAAQPTAEQQGAGFGQPFQWDVPLTDGYRCRVLRPSRPGESVHSDRFWGLDVPEIASAIRESRPHIALIPGWHSVTLARAAFGLPRSAFVVLFAGKLEPKKCPLDLVRAIARMDPPVSLLVVGAGEQEAECRAEARKLGVELHWAGFLNQTQLGRVYAAA